MKLEIEFKSPCELIAIGGKYSVNKTQHSIAIIMSIINFIKWRLEEKWTDCLSVMDLVKYYSEK